MENTQGIIEGKVSIIIPCITVTEEVKRCVDYCLKLPQDKEILLIPDYVCAGYPAVKRNFAMQKAKGSVFAFIDSDAYPSYDWLENALIHLEKFSGVCGPGVLPSGSSLLEQAADLVYKCLPYAYRVTPQAQRIVKEFPTFNLIVRRESCVPFKNYLTGEDSLFCRELKGPILYDPKVMVYHSRRPLFKPYWKQISTYGWHRGKLIRLALIGWISTFFVYPYYFIKGFFEPGPREDEEDSIW